MPAPEQLGPLAAHLVSDGFAGCHGRVVFTAGSEAAVIEEPRLLEVLDSDGVASLAHALEAVTPGALVPAELDQESRGGTNPRFGSIFDEGDAAALPSSPVRSCAVVSDRADVADAVVAALEARGVACRRVGPESVGVGFDGAADALAGAVERDGPVDGVVVAPPGLARLPGAVGGWERVLAEHRDIVEHILDDAGWARAVADLAARTGKPTRLVMLLDAGTAGGRSRAQACAQLTRAARAATDDRVAAFAVSVETSAEGALRPIGELAAHLLGSPDTTPLSGAELVVGAGSIGLRSHPRVGASMTFASSAVPGWFDDALRSLVR